MNIYFMNISMIGKNEYDILLKKVSATRRMKCLAYRNLEDAKRSVCAEVLLKYAINRQCNCNHEFDVRYNEYGKPYLYNMPEIHYNISHAGDWVVVILGKEEMGVDVEMIQEPSCGMVEEFFSDEDIAYINCGKECDRAKRFTKTWTVKESYIKYIGTGLSTDLDSFFVDIAHNKVYDLKKDASISLFFDSFVWDEKYCVATCSLEKEKDIQVVSMEELLQVI